MVRGAIDRLSGVWEFIQEVQRDGIVAIWRFISDQLSSLWTTLLSMAMEWIMTAVITKATIWLLGLLDPTFIMTIVNSCIVFFNAVVSAVEYLREMLEVLNAYVSTLAAVAAGNVVPGAQMLEAGLASIIPIAIGFLARQVGLGNIPRKIVELIERLREIIDEAVDWLIGQALRLGRAALDALGLGADQPEAAPAEGGAIEEVTFVADGDRHRLFREGPDLLAATPMINPDPARPVETDLTALEARIATDLPIAEDRTTATDAAQAARGVLALLGQPPPGGKTLSDLEPHMQVLYSLLGHPDVPPSVVDGHLAAMGTHVTALPLTRKAGNTRGNSATTAAHALQRRDIVLLNAAAGLSPKGYTRVEWVAAHLLSARLHGPNEAGNFTTLSTGDNGVLRRGVEVGAINLLAANEGRNMLWWDAVVTPREAPLEHWAESLTVSYGWWDAATGKPGAKIDSVTRQPRPDFIGARTVASLSEDSAARMSATSGMNEGIAETIVAVREAALGPGGVFRNYEHFYDVVMATPRTASGGRLAIADPEKVFDELVRLERRVVISFGFDPDEDLERLLQFAEVFSGGAS